MDFDVPPDYTQEPNKMPRPYVEFVMKSVEKRDSDGRPAYMDIPFVRVTAVGGKDTFERDATGWIEGLTAHAKAGRVPPSWPMEYTQALERWKSGQEIPVHGTPIKTWPPLSPGQRQAILSVHVLTVEDLALANDETCERIGMGGRSLIQMAQRWVEDAKGPGAMAARLSAAEVENSDLKSRIKSLEDQIATLSAALPPPATPAPARPTGKISLKE